MKGLSGVTEAEKTVLGRRGTHSGGLEGGSGKGSGGVEPVTDLIDGSDTG